MRGWPNIPLLAALLAATLFCALWVSATQSGAKRDLLLVELAIYGRPNLSMPILFELSDGSGSLVDGGALHNGLEPAAFELRRGIYRVVVWPTCSLRVRTTGFNVVAVTMSAHGRAVDCSMRQFA